MNKKTAILVQARLGSSRFPRKIFAEVDKKSVLKIGIERLKRCKKNSLLIYIIPDSKDNDELESYLKKLNCKVFRGSEKDLMRRYLECANFYSIDTIVRITSDCPLVDPVLVDKFIEKYIYLKSENLYLSNYTPPEVASYCNGSDIEIFSKKLLQNAYKKYTSPLDREHVTFQFWDGRYSCKHIREDAKFSFDIKRIRLTIDYLEDIIVLKRLSEKIDLVNSSLEEICRTYLELNLFQFNARFDSRAGWI